jgi:NADPH:quinone reductase-like Zn-dependent oxidoreductase
MRLYQLDLERRSIEGLAMTERPTPRPGPGEVLIRMHAFSLNFRDLLIAKGLYPVSVTTTHLVPVSDGSGEVVEVGSGVTRCKPGDRIVTSFFQGWIDGPLSYPMMGTSLGGGIEGVFAEYVSLSQDGIVRIPDSLSYEEAATLPCAAVTAWNALIETGHLKAGQSVLLQGTGGVSIFALQLAHALGARVIITSSSDQKLAKAQSLGAEGLINYKTHPSWEKNALELTGGLGVDHLVELGGSGTLAASLQALGIHGQLSIIGVLTGGIQANIDFLPVLIRSARLQGIFVGSRKMLERVIDAVVEHRIKPVIDRVFPFDDALAAYRLMESGGHFGKITLRI